MPYDPTTAATPFNLNSDTAKCYTNYPRRTGRRLVQNIGRQIQAVDETGGADPKVTPAVTKMIKHPK